MQCLSCILRRGGHSVSQDLNHLHELHKLPHFTNQDVRMAVIIAAQKLPEPQWETVQLYLDHGARLVGPQDAVDAAVLLDSLSAPKTFLYRSRSLSKHSKPNSKLK